MLLLDRRISKVRRTTSNLIKETESLDAHTEHIKASEAYRRGQRHKEQCRDAETEGDEDVEWSRSSSASAHDRSRSRRVRARVTLEENARAQGRYISLSSASDSSSPARSNTAGTKVELKPNMTWKGGRGKHASLKEPKAKTEVPAALVHLGGMRDPHKAVIKLPTLQEQGAKLWERWRKFVPSHAGALTVAESYSTEACAYDEDIINQWRKELCDLWQIEVPKAKIANEGEYVTPVLHEMLAAWTRVSGDPDGVVVKWLREGTPLRIELDTPTTGVFPPSDEALNDDVRDHVVGDAVLERPDTLKNYKSVEDDVEEAEIELDRYEKLGYLRRLSVDEAKAQFDGGTVSKLGLVLKTKENGEKKRRIVIDLRRSGGNGKSRLPERLTLPHLIDALKLMKEVRKRSASAGDPDD
eukprot:s1398_g22.t1